MRGQKTPKTDLKEIPSLQKNKRHITDWLLQ